MAPKKFLAGIITRDLAIVHFLLMLGYKLFSGFFPLFLAQRGFSLPQVGWSYLLIYLPIALFAPVVGFATKKIDAGILVVLGTLGYFAYAVGMALADGIWIFYFWQVALGISAAIFFTASRELLMANQTSNMERSFSWFYVANIIADAFAPAIGALLIIRYGFIGVFIAAATLAVYAAVYAVWHLKEKAPGKQKAAMDSKTNNFKKSTAIIFDGKTAPLVTVSFCVLLLGGFYSFFILYLKDILGWSQNLVLFYTALSSAVFSLLYVFVIRLWQGEKFTESIVGGGLVAGLSSIILALALPFLNFFGIFMLQLAQNSGYFVAGSARSALVARKLKKFPQEAGVIDTIFSPLAVALGSLAGGFIVAWLGYQWLFFISGAIIITALIAYFLGIFKFVAQKNKMG